MTRLAVVRHAKSSWAAVGLSDFERSLNQRGRDSLPKIGEYLSRSKFAPAHIVCSTAARTRQTLDGLLGFLSTEPNIDFNEELYNGAERQYFDVIRALTGGHDAMIVGHNPMCSMFAISLCGGGDEASIRKLHEKFPAGAVAMFELAGDNWAQLQPGGAILADFYTPRDAP